MTMKNKQGNGELPRGRGAALPLGQARGSYHRRSQKIDLLAFLSSMSENIRHTGAERY